MFEKEIKFISDFCLNKVKGLGSFFTYDKLAETDLHPAILRYISAELDYMIYADRKKLLQNSYFDYSGKEIFQRFHEISSEIKKTKKISIEDVKKLIVQAVSFNANFVVRPKWSVTKLIYHDLKYVSVDELEMMLNYIYYYSYIKTVLAAYLSKRKIVQLSATEFDLILNKIDRELFKTNADQLIYNALKSIGDFFNIGGLDKTKVSPIAVEILLKEKNLVNYLLNLRRALPIIEGAKKEYDIEDIQKVLFSPTQVEPETDKTEVDEKIGSDDETERVNHKESEQNVVETIENKTLGELADEHAEELEKAEMGDLLDSEEDKLMEMYEQELKDLDNENLSEIEINRTSEEELFEEITDEDIEQVTSNDATIENIIEEKIKDEDKNLETEREDKVHTDEDSIRAESEEEEIVTEKQDEKVNDNPPEKEIVGEMIDDYFGEETEHMESEKETIEKNEIPEASDPSEVETVEETYLDDANGEIDIPQKIGSLEDELLEVFEELDEIKSDTPEEEKILEPEHDELFIPEDILPETDSSEMEIEQKVSEEGKISEMDSIDRDLETVDETAFTDDEEIGDKYINESGRDVDDGLEEINDELQQLDEETEELESEQALEEEQEPVEEFVKRKNDLFGYLKRKEIKKITNSIFGGDEMDFVTTIEKISECPSYKEATEILKGVFFSYKISPFAKEAVMFTNAVSNYFRQT
ncbi:MAG: hypothetical protein HKM87_11100 [Ignavibacteriaceae bacterium]|nr:hypothetical protein [Ignavibacteriaceae bacterium]